MTPHRIALGEIVEAFQSLDSTCGIVLIGSVAHGNERPQSDLDLNLFFSGSRELPRHAYIGDDNRWQLKVKDQLQGIRIDVAWETYEGLSNCSQATAPVLAGHSRAAQSCTIRAAEWRPAWSLPGNGFKNIPPSPYSSSGNMRTPSSSKLSALSQKAQA
jgi:predicted nucleotidyltransferase